MSLVSDAVSSVVQGGINAAGGPVSAAPAYQVNQGNFQDPNLAKNQALLAQRISGVQAPTAATDNTAGLISALQARASGAAPSVAQTQLAQTTQANQRAAMGMAATAAPGTNPALNLRSAIQAGTEANQASAGQAATLRATEQTQAEQNLLSAVQTQAGQEQVQNQLVQQYTSMGLSLDEAQFQASQAMEQLKASAYYGGAGLNLQAQQTNLAAGTNMLGAAAGAGAAAAIFSDKRLKMKVRPAKDDVQEMLDEVSASKVAKYAEGGPVRGPSVRKPTETAPSSSGGSLFDRLHPMHAGALRAVAMRHYAAGGPVTGAPSIFQFSPSGPAKSGMGTPDQVIANALAATRPPSMGNLSGSIMQGADLGAKAKAANPGFTPSTVFNPDTSTPAGGMIDPLARGGGYAEGGPVVKTTPRSPAGRAPGAQAKISTVMHEFGKGKLHSGSPQGETVTDPQQAVAIALNSARRMNKAGGGPIAGPGGPKDDQIPAMLSNGENVWNAEDVQRAGGQQGVEQLKDLLEHVHAQKFAYKGEGPGAEHIGVMAQDMEKSPLGRTMVLDTPRGKMVDTRMLMPAVLAAAAELNRRVTALEGKRSGGHRG